MKKESPRISSQINEEFLGQLTKIYKSRYLDNVSPGYNFVILRKKYLAELDFTFSILEPLLRFENLRTGHVVNLQYQKDVEKVDPRLFHDNYILKKISKHEFVESVDLVHELRIIFTHETFECIYYTEASKNDGKFSYNGLVMQDDNKNFNLSHMPFGK